MKRLLTYLLLLLPIFLMAQTTDETLGFDATDAAILDSLAALDEEFDSIMAEDIRIAFSIQQTELDKSIMDWAMAWLDTTECTSVANSDLGPDSLLIARLQALPNDIPLPYNSIIRLFIQTYIQRRPRQVASMMRISEVYFPIFENKLGEYGMPYELKYLPIIESALNSSVYSRAGAAGLWQFMPSTGKNYGLEVNSLVDERLDPYKATDAACRFLRSLYNVFGDWHLVLAAYNCGPGNVNKAIRRAGGKKDYWAIYPYLPKETRNYVPGFIAVNYAFNYAAEHGICPAELHEGHKAQQKEEFLPLLIDTIHTDKRMHLVQISDILGLPLKEVKRLNPAYVKNVVPGGKDYILYLPIDYAGAFVEYEDTILSYKADSLINSQKAVIEIAQKTANDGSYSANGVTYYKVKRGDTLGGIAQKYHCSVKQLQRWNGLKGTTIQIGQKIKIMK